MRYKVRLGGNSEHVPRYTGNDARERERKKREKERASEGLWIGS